MSSNVSNLVADSAAHIERIVEQVHNAAENASREGAEFMRSAIETSGTRNTWSKTYYKDGIPRRESNPGRVWTGHMLDSVGSETQRGKSQSTSSFGWIKDQEPYFLEQEGGFLHEEAGVVVAGMYALQNAREHAITMLENELRSIK